MDVTRFLQRLRYQGSRAPTLQTLRALQRAFLLSVPFENLDIHLGREIRLEPQALYDKIVGRRRGGFCYECNGLFRELLRALGFEAEFLSARMSLHGRLGPEFDHIVLRVAFDRDYVVDVGNGQSCREPLPVEGGTTSTRRFNSVSAPDSDNLTS